MNPYDWQVNEIMSRAIEVCGDLNLDAYSTDGSGVERWRYIALDLLKLRAQLRALGVSVP